MYSMFDELCEELHKTAVEKGFWPEDVDDIFNKAVNDDCFRSCRGYGGYS